MSEKIIAFEKWLISNYPDREDNPEYACDACDGDGYIDDQDVEYVYPNDDDAPESVQPCISCFATGSAMYLEYEKQCEIDQERLRNY